MKAFKGLKIVMMSVCLLFGFAALAAGETAPWQVKTPKTGYKAPSYAPTADQPASGLKRPQALSADKAQSVINSFQVMNVSFDEVVSGQNLFFKIDVDFSRDVDLSTIAIGTNFRLLRQSQPGFWVDAYQSHGNLQGSGRHITWLMDEPLVEGTFKLHLRGTIKNTNGEFLDCDGDGTPEGGNMPAYESPIYYSVL